MCRCVRYVTALVVNRTYTWDVCKSGVAEVVEGVFCQCLITFDVQPQVIFITANSQNHPHLPSGISRKTDVRVLFTAN